MKKKFLCLTLCVAMTAGVLTGCGEKETKKETVSYADLQTSTDEAFADLTSGKIVLSVNSDLSVTAEDEPMDIAGTVNMNTSFDEDTMSVDATFDLEGALAELLPLTDASAYIDYADEENAVIYLYDAESEVWMSMTGTLEDVLSEMDMSFDADSVKDIPEMNIFDEDIEVKSIKDGYELSQTFTGSELVEIMKSIAEEELAAYEEILAPYLDKLSVNVKATYNSDKVMSAVEVTFTVDGLDIEGAVIDGSLTIKCEISDINNTAIDVPSDVTDNAILMD